MTYSNELPSTYRRFPKVPLERRAYAFLLDFLAVWFLSSFFQGFVQDLVFIAIWLILRVIIVEKNKGQSLGSWAFDLKVIDLRFSRIPGLKELTKREVILGFAALLAMIGLNINVRNGLSMLILITPLIIDCSIALGDENYGQAFHDRIAQTMVIQTERGFSLDLRLKQLWNIIKKKLQSRKNQNRDNRDNRDDRDYDYRE
ncbi:RDD family protein [Crocosphaera sp. XPORK-15E]|uniref:RDD family protein n=1 Tax=Crocosphaera sp. XPORK-15E TaxID=3110247 RepID=UPI002B1EC190|nr:RDD family protein [Crocosphaera sp. XPORK-15E]MEA5535502.1 RDD family protein [Crocosphaera sp. XPORK-15E]